MTISTKIIRQAFLLIPLLAVGLLANAQSSTVTVTNNTGCDLYVTVYGAVTAGNCSGPGSNASGMVAAGTTPTTLAYSGTGVYYNVGATSTYLAPHPGGPNYSWAPAVHPLQTCVGAVNRPGASSCGIYYISITAAGNVVIN